MQKRYAFAGASRRGLHSYAKPMVQTYTDVAIPVGVYDTNAKRSHQFVQMSGENFPVYTDFETMIRESKPDTVIVTCVDAFHHDYVIKAMEMGCDVICEKPLTTDADKANAIIRAQKETGKDVIVTFNCRYMPFFVKVKELLASGAIGDVVSIHLEWMLDFDHGTSYYRRWNGEMKYSQGLQLHKCTHHFDLANWFAGSEPETVFAFGDRRAYGPENGKSPARYCHECSDHCKFYTNISKDRYFLPFKDVDGYTHDQCIYRDAIDVQDVLAVNVRYQNRALLSYSLNAASPYEGSRFYISGTKGRIEADNYANYWNPKHAVKQIRLYPFDALGTFTTEEIPTYAGGHDGADDRMRDDIFLGRTTDDPLCQAAGVREGLMSIGIGIGINQSIKNGIPINVHRLFEQ
ncbi:MAG TPA: gfo/Idh/MocA family oxidoreductase [Clostridiales bacterium]|jgi:predicted dehydrogenase|nr:gfo/Idh/MocA family oxidoreductase [Clostridiales bacterium]